MATKSSSTSTSPLTAHAENGQYSQPYDLHQGPDPLTSSAHQHRPHAEHGAAIDHKVPHPAQPHAEHGAPIDHKVPQENVVQSHPDLLWSRTRHFMREPFSECLGTFILVLFGDGAIAQVVLSDGTKGDWQSICWGYGIGIMLGVYTSGISGGHINPAVTLTNAILRRFPWRKVPLYFLSQLLGAMLAAAVIYGNYRSAITFYEGSSDSFTVPLTDSTHPTAGIFATYPAPFMTTTGMFFSEFLGSALLMFSIYALKDEGNIGMPEKLVPVGLFFVLWGIAGCFGWETGFALNPARDFGPRIVTSMIGYGKEVWTVGNGYAWVPIIAPFCGCAFGGWLYDMFLFTGESPINTEGAGLKRLLRPRKEGSGSRMAVSALMGTFLGRSLVLHVFPGTPWGSLLSQAWFHEGVPPMLMFIGMTNRAIVLYGWLRSFGE